MPSSRPSKTPKQDCSEFICPIKGRGERSRSRRECLIDLRAQNGLEILWRDRANELKGNARIAADDEGFRYAIDAPFDRRAAVLVGASRREWIAIAAEKAPGIVGVVLVIDADDP